MREKKRYMIIGFDTLEDALYLEKLCDTSMGRIIPTPGELSAGCGYAWRSEVSQEENIKKILWEHEVVYSRIIFLDMY